VRISTHFFLNFLIIIVLVLIFSSIISYHQSRRQIVASNTDLERQIEKSIRNNIETVSASYKMLGKVYDDELRPILAEMQSEYREKGKIEKIDLAGIKKSVERQVDLYVLNMEGVIIATTYKTDLGLDLSGIEGFFEKLRERFRGSDFVSDAVTPEVRTGKLRKYAYLLSHDRKYIFEVGLHSQEFDRYLEYLSYSKFANLIFDSSKYVKSIEIYRASDELSAITLYGKPDAVVEEEARRTVRRMFIEKTEQVLKSEADRKIKYLFLDLREEDIPTNLSKVVRISYDISLMKQKLNGILSFHIVFSLLIILVSVVSIYYLSKTLTKPIVQVTENVDSVARGNLGRDAGANIRPNHIDEIDTLVGSIEKMVDSLQEKITQLSEQKRELEASEQRVRESENHIRSLFEAAKGVAFVKAECRDEELPITEFSPGAERLFKYAREEILGRSIGELHTPEDAAKHPELLLELQENRRELSEETSLVRSTGETFPALLTIYPVIDDDGVMVELIEVAIDITARKHTEVELQKLLEERTVLLKEIHHRVKNNLATINAILNLQKDSLSQKNVMESLEEAKNRIRAIAIVHEQFYKSDNYKEIDIKTYIENIFAQLARSHGSYGTELNVDFEIEDIRIEIDRAVPYGLILNELLSNEYKHAFAEGEEGLIRVELYEREGSYRLILCDNGLGLPPDFEELRSSSMGLQIVDSLVSQIKGSITYLSKNFPDSPTDYSTEIRLEFPHG